MKLARLPLLFLPVIYLCALDVQAQDCHTGSDVAVNLIAPSASGTLATPVRFTATATSGHTITGYVVYTNATGNYVNSYQSAKSTLDAWVILPLTSTGGSKVQNVFVRAWNSQGFCGDSPTRTITASGTQLPTPLAGSVTFPNGDDDLGGDGGVTHGWGMCGDPGCSGGTNTATVSFAQGQTPTKDGTGSIRLNVTGANYANGLFWYKVGAQNSMSNFIWDFWFQLSSTTTNDAQAIEFDLFQSLAGQRYMFGTQCNYATGVWQAWNETAGVWVDAIPNTRTDQNPTGTPISCSKFSTGVWHHAQFFFQRTFGGLLLYGNVKIDSAAPVQWNILAPSKATTWADVLGINHQLDTNGSFTGSVLLQEWADVDTIKAWPQD